MNKRYYYKIEKNNRVSTLNLKTPLNPIPDGYEEITEDQYNEIITEKNQKRQVSEKNAQIANLKRELVATDYKAIKYAEGLIGEEDYAPIKAHRQALRDEINMLEEN